MTTPSVNDPLRALGFSVVPDGYSFMVTAMDHEAAIAAARAQARDTYRRELGAVIYVGREGDSTEVVATLRTDGKLAFRPSGYNTPGDGLDPNGITALVAAMAESRGMVQS